NVCVADDDNMLSVLQYAVNVLEVKHVIVCGHYGCGGVQAAMSQRADGSLERWLGHIRKVYEKHEAELSALPDDQRFARLVEWNARAQAETLVQTSIIQDAWRR